MVLINRCLRSNPAVCPIKSNQPFVEQKACEYLKQQAGKIDARIARYIIFRHGQTAVNISESVGGQTDFSVLTELGISQAQELGANLKSTSITIHKTYSSPLPRAKQTVLKVLKVMGKKTTVLWEKALKEKHFGKDENVTKDQYKKTRAKEEKDFEKITTWEDRFRYKVRKGDTQLESWEQVCMRAMKFLEGKAKLHLGKNVLISTHKVVMKVLLMRIWKDNGTEVGYRQFDLKNCSIFVIEIDRKKKVRLSAVSGIIQTP